MSADTNPNQFQFRPIKTVGPVDTTEFYIRLMDWKRIYRKVKLIPEHSSFYSNAASVMAGVAGSAFLSLFPLYQAAQPVEAWIKPTYWAVGLGATVLTLILYLVSRDRDKDASSNSAEVMKDMKEIHEISFPGQEIEPVEKARNVVAKAAFRCFWGLLVASIFLIVFSAIKPFGAHDWVVFFGSSLFSVGRVIKGVAIWA